MPPPPVSRFIESGDYRELKALHDEDRRVVGIRDFDIYRFLGAGGFGMVRLQYLAAILLCNTILLFLTVPEGC